jgi:nucleoside-diphosphate-sugar epimerase
MSELITGGAGFVGSHLTETLLERGKEVTVADNCEQGQLDNLSAVRDHENLTIVTADLTEESTTREVVEGHSKVYHLAAKIGGVGYLREKPAEIMSSNDLLNKRIFDACVSADVNRILFPGSSMVYSESESYPHKEEDVAEIPPPRGSYGFQKLNGEYYCDAYAREFSLDYAVARIFNAIGPRDWPEQTVGHGHVVPDMVKKIVELNQNPVQIKGTGKQTRSFIDVRDLVSCLILCMEKPEAKNEVFNIGTMREISINKLVETIWEVSERDKSLQTETNKSFSKDIKRRVPDNNKIKTVLDWSPSYTLEESLENYITQYKEVYMDES